jgi:NAD(P)-dependent dehydrogenase (short-subunit alcohol dehydrogenase family)
VVIIGGTSGMGLATAKMLLDGGARVLVTGRSQAGLESAQKELGKGALVVSSDARSLTDIDALASRVKAEFDTFDLLFVNAGLGLFAPLENTTEAVYDEMFNLNAKGPFFAVQKLAPLMSQGGAVVLTTAIANVKGMRAIAAYGAATAALRPSLGYSPLNFFLGDSRQRGVARPHRHADHRQSVQTSPRHGLHSPGVSVAFAEYTD